MGKTLLALTPRLLIRPRSIPSRLTLSRLTRPLSILRRLIRPRLTRLPLTRLPLILRLWTLRLLIRVWMRLLVVLKVWVRFLRTRLVVVWAPLLGCVLGGLGGLGALCALRLRVLVLLRPVLKLARWWLGRLLWRVRAWWRCVRLVATEKSVRVGLVVAAQPTWPHARLSMSVREEKT